ncbi:MAG: sigma-54-dependent Fis family transcriptional regulator [Nitrospirae bacterium]|nr:sigma-54-dependent Fis family transcriptional regulator [Nitrospirota bacterium]
MKPGNILVVDDEQSQREIMALILRSEKYEVDLASTAKETVNKFQNGEYDLVLTDLKLPDTEGLGILQQIFRSNPLACVIIMTAHGSIDSAVEAMKQGALDYLTKPLDREELLIAVKRAFEKISLVKENNRLRQQLQEKFHVSNIIGDHPRMQEIFAVVKKISNSTATVLISGESGTGKELLARAIHFNSARKSKPFQAINCAAIPETLIESELFGYEKGAFTGAANRRIGLFEAADGGTLFLDEVGDLNLHLQGKLLRALQEKKIRRLGGSDETVIDVRVIAATNKRLDQEIKKDQFREDLYYRLNVISIQMPPLRERGTDIPTLVSHFIQKYNRNTGKQIGGVSREAMRKFLEYSWPGNVRQLESSIERAVLLCEEDVIGAGDLPPEICRLPSPLNVLGLELPPEGVSLEDLERELIYKAMEQSDWIIMKAAKLLGLTYKTLQYRLEKHGIKRPDLIASNEAIKTPEKV